MWFWRRVEISWTDRVRYEGVLHREISYIQQKEGRLNGLLTPCLLKQDTEEKIEGRIEVTEDEEKDVSSYWKILRNREILEMESRSTRSHCVKNSLWKGYGPVLRQTVE
jgi:N-acetyl-anhydromuramyl-L-alanine amidase AmpD